MNNQLPLKPVALLVLSALLTYLLVGCGDSTSTLGTAATASPSPGLVEGQELKPAFAEDKNLTLRYTAKPGRLTQQQALLATRTNWSKSGEYIPGRKVDIKYTFGLATFGYSDEKAKAWIGFRDIPLYSCKENGSNCTLTGEKLARIENRPMWFIDTDIGSVAAGCPDCKNIPVYNRTVYVVDDETGTIMFVWSYTTP